MSTIACKALQKTGFSKLFVFRNVCFSKIRVGTSFSSFFRTRLDSRKLVPTLIFAKNCEKLPKNLKKLHFFAIFVFASFDNSLLPKFSKVTKNDLQLVSSRLAKTRPDSKTDSKFQIKVWNAGP